MSNAPTIELHPWNTSFEWERTETTKLRRLTPEQAAQFDDDGYVVLEDVFTADELAPVIADLDRFDQRMDDFMRTQEGGRLHIGEVGAITFSPHAVAHSDAARAFSHHPAFLELCLDLVGPDVRLYWDQLVYKKPEKPRPFPWHQDNGYTFIEPQQYLTCWVALNDATVDNGCPQVVPGIHKRGTLRHTFVEPLGWECFHEHPDAVAAPVRAGGIVVFSSLTPHLTGPNTTEGVRKAYILQYAPDGAAVLRGDPDAGPAETTERCDAPERQYSVLVDGKSA